MLEDGENTIRRRRFGGTCPSNGDDVLFGDAPALVRMGPILVPLFLLSLMFVVAYQAYVSTIPIRLYFHSADINDRAEVHGETSNATGHVLDLKRARVGQAVRVVLGPCGLWNCDMSDGTIASIAFDQAGRSYVVRVRLQSSAVTNSTQSDLFTTDGVYALILTRYRWLPDCLIALLKDARPVPVKRYRQARNWLDFLRSSIGTMALLGPIAWNLNTENIASGPVCAPDKSNEECKR